ncbi:MAG: efflux RND transporter periplasmic adaptor subunit [Clostridium sp.]|nr:efflux RND transporter periplasmic adaptor subunit [Acetatifactor muris]MCM1526322.1 efflux RND transporter periplasmic adaptor subunit [Bacteroides sp.]MCM1562861.1 efflux RND transporter periplasmic adaptor subunit [Clostridium sp.]
MKNLFKKGQNQENTRPKSKKKHKKTVVIIIVIVVIVLLLFILRGCGGGEAAAVVTTANAVRGGIQESVSTSGNVAAEEVKVFFAPTSGKLQSVNVEAGDAVKAGDVLIAYDEAQLESDFRQASLQQDKTNANYNGAIADSAQNSAKLSEANTNLPVLEQQIADKKAYLRDLQSRLSESTRGTGNALAGQSRDLQQEKAEVEQKIAELTQKDDAGETIPLTPEQELLLQEKEKRLDEINRELTDNTYLQQTYASSDYVTELETEIQAVQDEIADLETYKAEMQSQKNGSENGVMDSYDKISQEADKELAGIAYSAAERAYNESKAGLRAEFDGVVTEVSAVEGSTVTEGVQLLKLESSESVKVQFDASKQDVEKLAVGQKAEVTISGNVYAGTVSKINRMAQINASNTPMVGVEIHIEEPDDRIILGLDAKLTIFTRAAEDVLLIPVEAVNADRNGDFLYVAENGVVVRKPVVCGISNDEYTEIVEGITEADQVIISYYGSLEEGMAVTVVPGM